MRFFETARAGVTALIALAAAAAASCSGQVSEGGSETNWLCSADSDCAAGQRCVEKRCAAAGGASTVVQGPDAGVTDAGAGGAGPTQGSSTTVLTEVLTVKGDPANCGVTTSCSFGRCLPITLERDPVTGHLPCSVVDVTEGSAGGCDPAMGLLIPSARVRALVLPILRDQGTCDVSGKPLCSALTICERAEATGAALQSCLNDAALPVGSLEWCYVDPDKGLGAPALVDKCVGTERRLLRFPPFSDTHTVLLACFSAHTTSGSAAANPGKIGDPFIPDDETRPEFGGYSPTEVNVEDRTPSCESGVGLVYGFMGRVTCPYGQPSEAGNTAHVDPADQTCVTPSGLPVTVPVDPQLVSRRPSDSVYCSCRCDGPDTTVAYCQCPGGFECKPLVNDYGFGAAQLAGSYCIKSGTDYTPGIGGSSCDRVTQNCGPP